MKKSKYTYIWIWICISINMIVLLYVVYTTTIISNKPTYIIQSSQDMNVASKVLDTTYGYENGNGKVWPPDVLNNEYAQPIKDASYVKVSIPKVYTNIGYVNTSYRQLGVLIPVTNSEHIHNDLLILMGRPLYVNRNKWQYYAISDQRNGVKLTVRVKGKAATNEYGVDEVYTNDIITVQGYRASYKVDLYENDYLSYS